MELKELKKIIDSYLSQHNCDTEINVFFDGNELKITNEIQQEADYDREKNKFSVCLFAVKK